MEAYVHGVLTRAVDDLVEAMGSKAGISKSEVIKDEWDSAERRYFSEATWQISTHRAMMTTRYQESSCPPSDRHRGSLPQSPPLHGDVPSPTAAADVVMARITNFAPTFSVPRSGLVDLQIQLITSDATKSRRSGEEWDCRIDLDEN
jgi:hypothetical protein